MKGEISVLHPAFLATDLLSDWFSAFGEGVFALLDGLIDVLDRLVAMTFESRLGILQGVSRRVKIVQRPAHVGISVIIELLHGRVAGRLNRAGGMDDLQRSRTETGR
jgi:hypothetical protein